MRYPILCQKNVRLWLAEISETLGCPAGLDDIPDDSLRLLSDSGFDWLYLICMWATGEAEADIARRQPGLQVEARQMLGGEASSLCSSCFAISGYQVPEDWGGQAALERLRGRMRSCGLKLMLDFIPNHTGISHPWARSHPEYFIEADLLRPARSAGDFHPTETAHGKKLLAHGRDPNFPPWIDTLQLNYGSPSLQQAMIAELLSLAERCDGLRCDMAMLVLPDVFQKTWGIQPETFWREAISRVRASHPGFSFLAEAYWGLEDELILQGFDFTYDKGLYDSLVERNPDRVLEQIRLETPWIERRAHFLENHDEPRAAAVFPPEAHRAAALVTYLLPGLRFFQSGQERGFRLRPPVQFCRPPQESTDRWLSNFYALLLEQIQLTRCREGTWKMCACIPAWDGDLSWRNYVVFSWEGETGENWLAAVNFSDRRSYCYAQLEIDRLRGRQFRLHDVLNGTIYQRPDDQIAEQGLYLDRPAWGYHLFEIRQID